MGDDNCATAREVHALLSSAHPHPGEIDLAKAAELASPATKITLRGHDNVQERTFLAIQKAKEAIDNGAGAAEGEELLLDAVRIAEQWVRSACDAE